MIIKFKRLFRRLRCKHQDYVWLRENTARPKGGFYPVKCCLDCGKLTWAIMTPPGTYRFLKHERMAKSVKVVTKYTKQESQP